MGKRVALIVGINEYEDPSFEKLKYAEADADAVYNVLINPDICEFEKENVILLIGGTKSQVEQNLEGILSEAKHDDFIFIYFAGHGKLDRSGSLCLAAKDTLTTRLLSSSVSLEHVRRIIDQSDCKRIVFILDSCFSGAVGQTFRSGEVPTESIEQISGQGKVIISASQAYERARERDDIGHGIFTYNLVKGLTEGEADFGSDGYITIDDIYKYVYETVKAETNGQQVPMKWGIDEKGEIIIAKSIKVLKEKREAIERKIKNAGDFEKEGKLSEALSAWGEVADLDPENIETKERTARIKELISNIDELFVYFDKRGLPGAIYNEAVQILKKPERTLTSREESCKRLVENLLNDNLSLQVFLDSWKRIEKAEIVIGLKEEGAGDIERAQSLREEIEEPPVVYQAYNVDESEIVEKKTGDPSPAPQPEKDVIGKKKTPVTDSRAGNKNMIILGATVLALIVIGVIISQTLNRKTDIEIAVPAPEILSFIAEPQQIQNGESATLKWDTSNADEARIEPLGAVDTSGSKTVRPSQTTSYKLFAQNKDGDVAYKIITVDVKSASPLPKINYFKVDSQAIEAGSSVLLSWDTSNAKRVEVKPIGTVESKGSTFVAPKKTMTYTLVAANSEGKSVTDNLTVNVAAKPADISAGVKAPKINYFRTNENNLEKGYPFILSWDTSYADEVEITGIGSVKRSGNKSLRATETKTYTLVVNNIDGTRVESAVTITVVDEAEVEGELPKIQYKDYIPVIPEAVRRQIDKKQ